MTIKEVRRIAVQRIIDVQFDGVVADFARKIGRSPAQVWQFMNKRGIGEKLARDIEAEIGAPRGSLDSEEAAAKDIVGVLASDEAKAIRNLREALPQWREYVLRLAMLNHEQQALFLKIAEARPAASSANEVQPGPPVPVFTTRGRGKAAAQDAKIKRRSG